MSMNSVFALWLQNNWRPCLDFQCVVKHRLLVCDSFVSCFLLNAKRVLCCVPISHIYLSTCPCFFFPGLERGMCEAADSCVWPGAAEPHPECAVSTTRQNVHYSGLPGKNTGALGPNIQPLREAAWIYRRPCSQVSQLKNVSGHFDSNCGLR